MTSNPNSPDFNYKNYSLEKLQDWVHDAMNGDASPHEIYSAIREAVRENYYYHKDYASRAYGLLELLSGHRPVANYFGPDYLDYYKNVAPSATQRDIDQGSATSEEKLTCDKDDTSPECQSAWNDFWEENYYPEESKKTNVNNVVKSDEC